MHPPREKCQKEMEGDPTCLSFSFTPWIPNIHKMLQQCLKAVQVSGFSLGKLALSIRRPFIGTGNRWPQLPGPHIHWPSVTGFPPLIPWPKIPGVSNPCKASHVPELCHLHSSNPIQWISSMTKHRIPSIKGVIAWVKVHLGSIGIPHIPKCSFLEGGKYRRLKSCYVSPSSLLRVHSAQCSLTPPSLTTARVPSHNRVYAALAAGKCHLPTCSEYKKMVDKGTLKQPPPICNLHLPNWCKVPQPPAICNLHLPNLCKVPHHYAIEPAAHAIIELAYTLLLLLSCDLLPGPPLAHFRGATGLP